MHVAAALKELGIQVQVHDDHFPPATPDVEWLGAAGERKWVILMADKRIRRRPMERQALIAAGVRAFVITSGNMTGPERAKLLTRHARRIVHLARQHPPPFLAAVTRASVRPYRIS